MACGILPSKRECPAAPAPPVPPRGTRREERFPTNRNAMTETSPTPAPLLPAIAPAASGVPALLRAARGGLRRLAGIARALRNRWAVAELAGLDDRALRDMGITRVEVRSALARPLAVDPSTALLVRRVEERARARALAIVRDAAASRDGAAGSQACRCG